MRLWTLHPCYLDPSGLVACWREGLLAKQVLLEKTKGYRHHPQLERFRRTPLPEAAIDVYLAGLFTEATRRGYRFNPSKFDGQTVLPYSLPVTTGQLEFERQHLLEKLKKRSPGFVTPLETAPFIQPHPLFSPHEGAIEPWEKRA